MWTLQLTGASKLSDNAKWVFEPYRMMFNKMKEKTQAARITACLQSNKRLKTLKQCILGRGPSIIRGVCFWKAGSLNINLAKWKGLVYLYLQSTLDTFIKATQSPVPK